jgi:hypothetical protein
MAIKIYFVQIGVTMVRWMGLFLELVVLILKFLGLIEMKPFQELLTPLNTTYTLLLLEISINELWKKNVILMETLLVVIVCARLFLAAHALISILVFGTLLSILHFNLFV